MELPVARRSLLVATVWGCLSCVVGGPRQAPETSRASDASALTPTDPAAAQLDARAPPADEPDAAPASEDAAAADLAPAPADAWATDAPTSPDARQGREAA